MSNGRLDQHPGCWNIQRRDSYMVPSATFDVDLLNGRGRRVTIVREIKDTSSRECRNDQRHSDPRCDGCMK